MLIPLALVLEHYFHASPTWVFAAGIIAIIPLFESIRLGTEEVFHKLGSSESLSATSLN